MKRRPFALVLLLGAITASRAGTDLTELSLEDLMKVEIPQVHSASQFDQKVIDAPAAVTIVTAADIERYGYRTLADILRSVRGFYTSDDRNYSYLGTRGFSRPGDYNSRILLLLDGHRQNDAVYGSASIGTEGVIDAALIDRVEIVRGPSSSLYGTEAFFGVVNVITKRGADVLGPALSAQAASWGTAAGSLAYGWSRAGGVDLLVSGTAYGSDGQRLYYPEFDTPATNFGIADHSDADRYQRIFGKVSFGEFTVETAHASRTKVIPTGSFGTVFNDPRNRTTDRTDFVDASYEHGFGDRSRIRGRLSLDWYSYSGTYVYDQPPIVLNRDQAWGDSVAAEVMYSTTAFAKHVLVVGGEARFPYRQDQANFDEAPFTSYLKANHSSRTFAAYVQDEFRPVKSWTLNWGLRFDHYHTFGSTLNPRIAVIYKPRENTAIKLLFGRAFRAPNAYELYYSDGFSTKPSTGLVPETIGTYEAVFEHYSGHGLRVSASAFFYRIADLISLQTDPVDGLLVFRNVNQVKSLGAEIEVARTWARGPEVRFSYTLQRSEDSADDSELTNSPRHLAKLNVTSPLVRDRLFAGVEVQYTSSRRTLAGSDAHGFTVANLTLFTRHLAKGFDVSASVYNLLDAKYGVPGSEEHVQDVIEQDGRGWRVTFRYAF
jgi:outer membrane receptor for ferrienterochelin and colicin